MNLDRRIGWNEHIAIGGQKAEIAMIDGNGREAGGDNAKGCDAGAGDSEFACMGETFLMFIGVGGGLGGEANTIREEFGGFRKALEMGSEDAGIAEQFAIGADSEGGGSCVESEFEAVVFGMGAHGFDQFAADGLGVGRLSEGGMGDGEEDGGEDGGEAGD